MCGVTFYYPDAIIKSVEEIPPVILENTGELKIDFSNAILETTIKNGLGNVSEYTKKGDLSLPDKAYRYALYAFAVSKSEEIINSYRMIFE